MKTVLFTGSHPRHLYVANTLLNAGFLDGLLIEERSSFMPEPPERLGERDRENFIRHFEGRKQAEENTFGKINGDKLMVVDNINIKKEELNSNKVKLWLKKLDPEIVITYGVHIIKDELLVEFPEYAWNIHGGLSPWYRGCITLFWPFYFLEPNWAGMTIHNLTSELDGGEIIHHSRPDLKYGDGIHDVATRAVVQVVDDLIDILKVLNSGKNIKPQEQKSSGKLFLARDWRPEHLRLIYNTFDNDIVDAYLDGQITPKEPNLIQAF